MTRMGILSQILPLGLRIGSEISTSPLFIFADFSENVPKAKRAFRLLRNGVFGDVVRNDIFTRGDDFRKSKTSRVGFTSYLISRIN